MVCLYGLSVVHFSLPPCLSKFEIRTVTFLPLLHSIVSPPSALCEARAIEPVGPHCLVHRAACALAIKAENDIRYHCCARFFSEELEKGTNFLSRENVRHGPFHHLNPPHSTAPKTPFQRFGLLLTHSQPIPCVSKGKNSLHFPLPSVFAF